MATMMALGLLLVGLASGAQAQTQRADLADEADTSRPLVERPLVEEEEPASRKKTWRLVVDGVRQPWSAPAVPLDSLRRAARAAVRHVQAQGHYWARLDSAVVGPGARPHGMRTAEPRATLYVRAGPRVDVGQVAFAGNEVLSDRTLRSLMDTRPGRPLRPDQLEADLEALLRRYEDEGYPLAQVRVDSLRLMQEAQGRGASEPPRLALTITIDEGAALRLARVEVEGGERTKARFVARTAGLQPDMPLSGYDPAALRERLRETDLYERVGAPVLLLAGEAGDGAVVRIPLKEKPPALFDLALGYLPPSDGARGRLVGSGRLALRSPFGAGRTAALRLDRRPGSVSRFEVEASDPFFLGTPLRLSLAFEGLQEDSTYAQQRYVARAGYRLAAGLRARAQFSREVTRPGIAGSRLAVRAGGMRRQRIGRATLLYGGGGVRLRRLGGVPESPRSGFHLEAQFAYGRKAYSLRRVTAAGDTVRSERTLGQQRFEGTARTFVSVFPRQVAAFGTEGAALFAGTYDRSDLFFLGGAGSLRGYDEDRFRGHIVGRAFAEYRYLLGRRSFAYGFFDLGYARRPALPGAGDVESGLHPGYGLGLQFDSRLGLVSVNYALNDEDGLAGGRVHLGLAVGL